MGGFFEGSYYKHQNKNDFLAVIPGRSENEAFIQILTAEKSYNIFYGLEDYQNNKKIKIGNNIFSKNGINLEILTPDVKLTGKLLYKYLTPISSDIMGPFKFLPMECRHSITSLHHKLMGQLYFNEKTYDFSDGIGYIESDRGKSFPEKYTWIHCNDFHEKCSIMLSIAKIPFLGARFWGCICIVWYRGVEYRLATYKGVKIQCCTKSKILVSQGKLNLIIEISDQINGQKLYAPRKGNMNRIIHESAAVRARFKFIVDHNLLFDMQSNYASFEYSM